MMEGSFKSFSNLPQRLQLEIEKQKFEFESFLFWSPYLYTISHGNHM